MIVMAVITVMPVFPMMAVIIAMTVMAVFLVMAVITVIPVFPVMTEAGMPNLLPEANVKPDVTHYHLRVATNFFPASYI